MKTLTHASRWIKLISIALVATLGIGLLGNATVANAQGGTGSGTGRAQLVVTIAQSLLEAASNATNLTPVEILQQMNDGDKTLAEVITANNGDVDAVKAAAKTDLTAKINQAVSANKLTQPQADALLKNLDTALDKIVTSPWPVAALTRLVGGMAKALLDASVQVTKLSQQDIIKQLAGGKTLAEVIKASNNDVNAVKDVATKTITDQIDQILKNGKLAQDQADLILKNLDAGLDKLLNAPWPNLQNADPAARLLKATATSALVKTTATESNITQRDLLKETRAGKTLAQIATEHGADPAKIIADVTTVLSNAINVRVKNGKISQDDATKYINALPAMLQQIMNTPFSGRPGKGNGGANPGNNTNPQATPVPEGTPSL